MNAARTLAPSTARHDEATRRARTQLALFRARLRTLRGRLDGSTAAAVALLPALFHASFPWEGLKTEAPGVEGARASLRWARMARDFDFPPPSGIQRDRRLVAALLLTPHDAGFDVHVVPAANLTPLEEQRIAQRARAVETLLRRRSVPITITATGPSAQPYDAASRSRLLSSGALLAGRLPDSFVSSAGPSGDPLAAELWRTAPTEEARVLALLALTDWPAGEAAELDDIAQLARAAGQPVWSFAEPGLFMAARAALRSKTPSLPFAAWALASPPGAARAAAQRLAAHLGHRGPLVDPAPAAVLDVGRGLALALTRAVRRVPTADAGPVRTRLERGALAAGFPRMLLAALTASLQQVSRRSGIPVVSEVAAPRGVEVRLSDDAVLGRGVHAPQAWARALALLGVALGRPVAPAPAPPLWDKLAQRLVDAPERRTLVLDIAPAELPGPPYDPLNRGPGRRLAMSGALLVTLSPGRRPSAREVLPVDVPRLVVRETLTGTQLDFVSRGTDVQSLEARLRRLARRVQTQVPQRPMAIELGGDVLVVSSRGYRQHSEPTFGRRPVRCAFDPEAPDFGVDASQGRDVPMTRPVQCLAFTDDDERARLLMLDDEGWLLRETVPLAWAEGWLAEAQAILRAPPTTALSVRADDRLTRATLTARASQVPDVTVSLSGRLPFGLELELAGERYGGRSQLPWSAAALALLSRWPRGVRGRIRFSAVNILVGNEPAGGLLRLYARSLALRKLNTYIEGLTRT